MEHPDEKISLLHRPCSNASYSWVFKVLLILLYKIIIFNIPLITDGFKKNLIVVSIPQKVSPTV